MIPYEKLDPAVKSVWLGALRSKTFRQTTQRLHRYRGGHCCLGVLCEVAIDSGGVPELRRVLHKPHKDDEDGAVPIWLYSEAPDDETDLVDSATTPPDSVLEWANLDPSALNALIMLNDGDPPWGKPQNFTKIADWIEENL
jgi:hypothetical protein